MGVRAQGQARLRFRAATGAGQRGFSLAELLVGIGIVGICAALAIPKMRNFVIIAQRAEAKTNLAMAYELVHTFRVANGRVPTLPEMGVAGSDVSFMTTGAASGCNIPNVVGFAVSNCKARYAYYYHAYPSPRFFVGAVTRTANHMCEDPGADWVLMFSNGHMCVLNDAAANDCIETAATRDPDCQNRWVNTMGD